MKIEVEMLKNYVRYKKDDATMRTVMLSLVFMVMLIGCSKPSATEMFKKGTELQSAEQYDGAVEQFQELVKTYPDSTQTPEALYALGTIYHDRKKDYHSAIQNYRLLITKFPDHATASNAAFLIGFAYNNDLKNTDSAKIAYNEFLKKYPTSPLVQSAQFELATIGKTPEEILKMQNQSAQNDKDADQD